MKIPIDIRVRSERVNPDPHNRVTAPATEDYTVSGTLKKTKRGYRIEYVEQGGDVTTMIDTFEDSTVTLNRVGPINTSLVFADGKAHTCICNTGFFPLQMYVRTKSIVNSITMEGGKLDIDYTVEIVGNLAEKSKISLSVSPDVSIIKS